MQCKVCGTINENYLEFCKKCASELPRESVAPVPDRVQQAQSVTFDPQPYDYRLPYRPGRGVPQGYERPPQQKPAGNQSPEYFGPRPAPSRELPVRPNQHLSAQMPPIPMPQGRVIEAPIVRIPDTYYARERPQQYPPQQPAPEQLPPRPAPIQAAAQGAPQAAMQQARQAPDYQQYQDPGRYNGAPHTEPDEGAAPAPKSKRRPPTPPKKSAAKPKQEYEDYDESEYNDEFDDEFVPKKGGALSVILSVSIALLFLAAVWFAGNYVKDEYGSIDNFIQTVLGGSAENPALTPADKITIDVQRSTKDGEPCHRIVFSGKDGQTIEVLSDEGGQDSDIPQVTHKKDIVSGVAVFIAMDNVFIPQAPDEQVGETIQAKLEANLIDTDGQVYKLDVPEFTVNVPMVTLTLAKPAANDVTIDKPELELEGKVSDGAKLKIDGEDVTALLDALGNFSYMYEIKEYGDQTITLEATASRSRPAKQVLNVSYPKREVPLAVDPSTPTSTTKDTVEVKGTMEKGASVEIAGTLEGDPTIDSEAGSFSFVGKLEAYGLNQFTVTASKDGASSETQVSVEKKPNVDEYTKKALKLEYDSLAKNASKQLNRIYLCEGKVQKLLQEEPYPVFLFNVGGSKEQLIVMEYYGTTKLDESKSYRIYGDVAGMDEEQGLPKIIARFVYVH